MQVRIPSGLLVVLFMATLSVVIWHGSVQRDGQRLNSDQLSLVTTVYPLANFAEEIGGRYIQVTNVIPAGAEPHDYEPSPRDITRVLETDMLVYLGGGLDGWAEALASDVTAAGGTVLGIEDEVTLAPLADTHEDEHADEEDGHSHEGVDPHIWLDPVQAQEVVLAIRDALIAVDPAHEREYRANAEGYIQKLKNLHSDYTSGLKNCELNDIIVSHDAFGYLARRYNFTTHPISGISPDAEPSIRDLARLTNEVEELGVNTIFFETLVSPGLAETLAAEVGAMTAVLDPLEGLSAEAMNNGEDYVSVMYKNLQALRSAMVCQ